MFDNIMHFMLMTTFTVKDKLSKPRDEEGATAVEYGLLVGLIAGVIVVAVTLLGSKVTGMFTKVNSSL
jgi:pilus assembly protein Flp/PilA